MKMYYSIITINYNNCEGLRRTIQSVVGQSFSEYEYIIIDGGSTDSSVDVIKEFESRVDYWVSEKDRGIYHAMNKGIAQAHGEYCIFMNSGDVFYDYKVLERITALKPEEDVVVGKVVIDENNTIISPPPSGEFTLYHLYSGAIPHQGSVIRTILLKEYPYDESLKISSDWKFFVEILILRNGTIRFVDQYVARYDLGGVSAKNPELMREEKVQVLAGYFPPRVLADYRNMKNSECLTQSLTQKLRINYGVDYILYKLGVFLLKLRDKKII